MKPIGYWDYPWVRGGGVVNHEPQVTKYGALDMQVCVPANWSDEEIVRFAESEYTCGTSAGRFYGLMLRGDCERRADSEYHGPGHSLLANVKIGK